MPMGEMHRARKAKNWTLFAILLGMFVLLFFITIMRIGAMTG